MRFLDRSFQDLPDSQLVNHLKDFFGMLERSMDHSMQLPLEEDLQEIRLLVCELQKGWESLLMPTTSSPSQSIAQSTALSTELLA
jgi:hypothetical protein